MVIKDDVTPPHPVDTEDSLWDVGVELEELDAGRDRSMMREMTTRLSLISAICRKFIFTVGFRTHNRGNIAMIETEWSQNVCLSLQQLGWKFVSLFTNIMSSYVYWITKVNGAVSDNICSIIRVSAFNHTAAAFAQQT